MSGPDPKRVYLAINSQNVEALKAEKPYWSKPFVFLNPTGTGTKYTAFQASMMLQKTKIVEFLIDQASVDMEVKATDGRNTVMIAADAKMPVPILEKILHKVDLKCLAELDPSGKGAIDYAEPGSDVWEFLHSMGCKTRQERESLMVGFFGESVRGTVPGVSEHQRRRKEGNSPRKKERKRISSPDPVSAVSENGGEKAHESDAPQSEEEEKNTVWREVDNIDDLETSLKAYLDEWGDDHREGQGCAHWLRSVLRAKETGKVEKLIAKWNANIHKQEKKGEPEAEDAEEKAPTPKTRRGRSSKRSASADPAPDELITSRGSRVDPEAVKLFFSGKAEDQVNLKHKGKNSHRLTFVVAPRSASAGPPEKPEEESAVSQSSSAAQSQVAQ